MRTMILSAALACAGCVAEEPQPVEEQSEEARCAPKALAQEPLELSAVPRSSASSSECEQLAELDALVAHVDALTELAEEVEDAR